MSGQQTPISDFRDNFRAAVKASQSGRWPMSFQMPDISCFGLPVFLSSPQKVTIVSDDVLESWKKREQDLESRLREQVIKANSLQAELQRNQSYVSQLRGRVCELERRNSQQFILPHLQDAIKGCLPTGDAELDKERAKAASAVAAVIQDTVKRFADAICKVFPKAATHGITVVTTFKSEIHEFTV